MGICSNGAIINLLINETVVWLNFIWFLKIMKNWLDSHNNFNNEDIVILLYNKIIHKNKETKEILGKKSVIEWYICLLITQILLLSR